MSRFIIVNAECRYGECRYVECRGAVTSPILLFYRVISTIKSFKVQINDVYIKNIFVRHWCWGQ